MRLHRRLVIFYSLLGYLWPLSASILAATKIIHLNDNGLNPILRDYWGLIILLWLAFSTEVSAIAISRLRQKLGSAINGQMIELSVVLPLILSMIGCLTLFLLFKHLFSNLTTSGVVFYLSGLQFPFTMALVTWHKSFQKTGTD
jgi:hypothetical protein